MPYIPRTNATTAINAAGAPREPLRSTADKPPIPYLGSGKSEKNPLDNIIGRKKMLSRLDMSKWDVDPLQVLKSITGKEFVVDDYNRLVPKSG